MIQKFSVEAIRMADKATVTLYHGPSMIEADQVYQDHLFDTELVQLERQNSVLLRGALPYAQAINRGEAPPEAKAPTPQAEERTSKPQRKTK